MTGQQLIERMVALLRHYVAMTEGQALVAALWALNTWTYERFAAVPYLEIWAMHKRSGKSTLAEILCALSRGGRVLATARVLAMVRMIEGTEGHYVPFLEESERFWRGGLGDERSILATGYRKGAQHEVMGKTGIERFRTFCPKAFVLIGNVHDILRDRCISLKMDRSTPKGNWTLDRVAGEAEAMAIIEAWKDVARTVTGPFPIVDPDWLTSSRDREIWSPLFSLAAVLKLHKATLELLVRTSVDMAALKQLPAVKYSPSQDEPVGDDGNAAEAVLRDVRLCLQAGETRVTTDELLRRLHAIDTAPWRSWRGNGLDSIALAALLVRFGIEGEQWTVGKSVTDPQTGKRARKYVRGYSVKALTKPV